MVVVVVRFNGPAGCNRVLGLLRLLANDSRRTVNVVIFYMCRPHLVNGVDGSWVMVVVVVGLQPPVGHTTVQQGLHHDGGRDTGDVLGHPGLHELGTEQ